MSNKLFPLVSYLVYWLKREDKYSLQSPFVYRLYQDLKKHLTYSGSTIEEIENFRKKLLQSSDSIEVLDLGAGSKKVNTQSRKISDITKYSTSSRKFGLLYQFFCQLTPSQNVIELGTCMGITTKYLSQVTQGNLFTFEGSEKILQVAKSSENNLNTQFILGEISDTLPEVLANMRSLDFALIDANHSYLGTIKYFNLLLEKIHHKSVIAIGDIYWSKEMKKAWEEIKRNPQVSLSLDFYECGVLMFDPTMKKQHYILDI